MWWAMWSTKYMSGISAGSCVRWATLVARCVIYLVTWGVDVSHSSLIFDWTAEGIFRSPSWHGSVCWDYNWYCIFVNCNQGWGGVASSKLANKCFQKLPLRLGCYLIGSNFHCTLSIYIYVVTMAQCLKMRTDWLEYWLYGFCEALST